MQFADWLSVIGFFFAGIGSTLGMLGVFKQARPFTSISMWKLPAHIARVLFNYLKGGKDLAYAHVRVAALTGSAAAQEALEPAPEAPPQAPAVPSASVTSNAGAAQNAAAQETDEQKAAKAAADNERRQTREDQENARKAEILDNLVALYFIFSGFVLQMIGAILLLLGALLAPHPGTNGSPGGG